MVGSIPGEEESGKTEGESVDDEAGRPDDSLQGDGEIDFKEERIGQQGEQAAGIGYGVEAESGASWVKVAEPGLHQGATCREDDVGDSDGPAQELEDVDHRTGLGGNRLQSGIGGDGKADDGHGDESEMHSHLQGAAFSKNRDKKMGICVADDQSDLEEKHAGTPDRRASTIPRKDKSRDDGLDLKEKKGTQENDQDEDDHPSSSVRRMKLLAHSC